jgi:hypothetical protein
MRNSLCHRRTIMARMHQKSKLNLEEKPYWINIQWPTLKSSTFTIQHHLGDLVWRPPSTTIKGWTGQPSKQENLPLYERTVSHNKQETNSAKSYLAIPKPTFCLFQTSWQSGCLPDSTLLKVLAALWFNSLLQKLTRKHKTSRYHAHSKMMGSPRWISESTTEVHASWYLGVPFPHCRLFRNDRMDTFLDNMKKLSRTVYLPVTNTSQDF